LVRDRTDLLQAKKQEKRAARSSIFHIYWYVNKRERTDLLQGNMWPTASKQQMQRQQPKSKRKEQHAAASNKRKEQQQQEKRSMHHTAAAKPSKPTKKSERILRSHSQAQPYLRGSCLCITRRKFGRSMKGPSQPGRSHRGKTMYVHQKEFEE
jgi:hypothetical protein